MKAVFIGNGVKKSKRERDGHVPSTNVNAVYGD